MAEIIKTGTLITSSKDFVFQNLAALREQLTVLFPLMLIFALINVIAESMKIEWMSLATFLPTTYLYACFALSWHRTSLYGPDRSHKVNPFAVRAEDKKFFLTFFALVLAPILLGAVIGGIFGALSVAQNTALMVGALIISVVAFIFFIFELVRQSFRLPANSVGVSLTSDEARKASKGLVWRIMLAMTVVSIAFFLSVMLYGFIVGLGLASVLQGDETTQIMSIFTGFFLSIPIHAAAMVLMAVNVTILSKAYQWGMQHNA